MPRLNGKPEKWTLYRQVDQLETDLQYERQAHAQARERLAWLDCQIEVLEGKIERIQQRAQEILGETTLDDVPSRTEELFMRYLQRRRRRQEELDQMFDKPITIAVSNDEISCIKDCNFYREPLDRKAILIFDRVIWKMKRSLELRKELSSYPMFGKEITIDLSDEESSFVKEYDLINREKISWEALRTFEGVREKLKQSL